MGKIFAVFLSIVSLSVAAQAQQHMPVYATQVLVGSWQLVKFMDSNGQAVTPANRTNYTITFAADGQVSVRFDCNQGTSTWATASKGEIHFAPLAITLAKCPEGSLHDRMVRDWPLIRSYTQ